MHFETAGSLHGGRRVWVLAQLPEHIEVGGDPVRPYVLLMNSQRVASHCLFRLGWDDIRSSLSRDRRAIRLWRLLGSAQRAISGRLDLLLRALSAPSRGLTARFLQPGGCCWAAQAPHPAGPHSEEGPS